MMGNEVHVDMLNSRYESAGGTTVLCSGTAVRCWGGPGVPFEERGCKVPGD